jgi:hypothetical protein
MTTSDQRNDMLYSDMCNNKQLRWLIHTALFRHSMQCNISTNTYYIPRVQARYIAIKFFLFSVSGLSHRFRGTFLSPCNFVVGRYCNAVVSAIGCPSICPSVTNDKCLLASAMDMFILSIIAHCSSIPQEE